VSKLGCIWSGSPVWSAICKWTDCERRWEVFYRWWTFEVDYCSNADSTATSDARCMNYGKCDRSIGDVAKTVWRKDLLQSFLLLYWVSIKLEPFH